MKTGQTLTHTHAHIEWDRYGLWNTEKMGMRDGASAEREREK